MAVNWPVATSSECERVIASNIVVYKTNHTEVNDMEPGRWRRLVNANAS